MDKQRVIELATKKFKSGQAWNNPDSCLENREARLKQYIKLVVERCEHYRRDAAMLEILLK